MTTRSMTIMIGHGGSGPGVRFLERLCQEHGVEGGHAKQADEQVLERFFVRLPRTDEEASSEGDSAWYPRALAIDFSFDEQRGSELRKYLRSDQLLGTDTGTGGSENRWWQGYENAARALAPRLESMFKARFAATKTFHIIHSSGGGTGSGAAAFIVDWLREKEAQREITTFRPQILTYTILPSEHDDAGDVAPYNTLLCLNALLGNRVPLKVEEIPQPAKRGANAVLLFDNEALRRAYLAATGRTAESQDYSELNEIIARFLLNLTSMDRVHGGKQRDIGDAITNLAPGSQVFLTPGMEPIAAGESEEPLHALSLIALAMRADHTFSGSSITKETLKAVYFGVRGDVDANEVEVAKKRLKRDYPSLRYLPNHHSHSASPGSQRDVVLVSNCEGIGERLRQVNAEAVRLLADPKEPFRKYIEEHIEWDDFQRNLADFGTFLDRNFGSP